MKWIECTLGDILNFRRGYDLPHSEMSGGDIPVAGSNGVIGHHNIATDITPVITIGRSGNVGTPYMYDKAWAHNTTLYIDDFKGNDPLYLFYLIRTLPLASFRGGSAVPTLNRNHIHPLTVKHCPDVTEQKRIAAILKSFDDKIALNNRINHNLEEQAQALYKSWFVDFEPFKDGKFVDSELGLIPEGWQVKNLLEVASLFDSKRKPLSGNERSQMDKIYPYYGATSVMDYVDDYIFDGTYLLMGEDGSVMTEEGFPFLQYVTGKFWPNNHAHVMQGCSGFSTEMLHCALLRKVIKSSVTGAVQAKISQANMKKIQFAYPSGNVLALFDNLIQKIYSQIRNIVSQNAALSIVRDNMLPRLLSGQLDV